MRQPEARDLKSFLAEPVEEVILEDVGTRSTGPLRNVENVGARFINPSSSDTENGGGRFINLSTNAQSGLNPLRPSRLQHYQAQGVYRSQTTNGTLGLRSSVRQGSRQTQARATADLAPVPHKLVPIEPSPTPQSWERRRRDIYMWLVLFMLFLLVVLGGIGLDSLIANYH